jgi:ABC-type molybdate transport system ATPase subunit
MQIITHSEIVNAPIENVWNALVLKIEQPHYFVPNVLDVSIMEKTEDYVIRKMSLQAGDLKMELVEKITSSPYIVRFDIISHPKNTGYVLNEASSIDATSTLLTYTMYWQDKIDNSSSNNLAILKAAVMLSKEFIETQLL